MQKQRSHDERQSRTHFYFVVRSFNREFLRQRVMANTWLKRQIVQCELVVALTRQDRWKRVINASSDAIATPVWIGLFSLNFFERSRKAVRVKKHHIFLTNLKRILKHSLRCEKSFWFRNLMAKCWKLLTHANFCWKLIQIVAMFAIRVLKKIELHWEPFAVSIDKEMLSSASWQN